MRSINAESLAVLQNAALSAVRSGATAIHIHISSDGGANDHGFAAYHFLRSLPVPVTTHCIGNVESMAVIMYLAGTHRIIVPHGKIKIHPMHWGFANGTIDHDRLAEFVSSLDFDAVRYAAIFKERTQGSTKTVKVKSHLAGKARILGAESALDNGISTVIGEAKIPPEAVIWWV